MRKLLAEGKIATYEKGEIVVRLIEQEDVIEEEALIAASRCNDVESAIELLAQECQLCMSVMKLTEVRFFLFFPSSFHARITPFVQALSCWLINHVIYLKLKRKQLLSKLSKFTK